MPHNFQIYSSSNACYMAEQTKYFRGLNVKGNEIISLQLVVSHRRTRSGSKIILEGYWYWGNWSILFVFSRSRRRRAKLKNSSGYSFFARWGTSVAFIPWPRFGGCICSPGGQRNSMSRCRIGRDANIWALYVFPERFGRYRRSITQKWSFLIMGSPRYL